MAVLSDLGRSFRCSRNPCSAESNANWNSAAGFSSRGAAPKNRLIGDKIEITLAKVSTPIPA